MNKNQSKYFNTAQLMNEALIILLDKMDYELITIKAICNKAGVNRSTFYLHYETMDDLLAETIENINKRFMEKFSSYDITPIDPKISSLDELVFINEQYFLPYLEFIKENRRVYQLVNSHPNLFKTNKTYDSLFTYMLGPIFNRFGISEEEAHYMLSYYLNGINALIMKWAENGCQEDINEIYQIVLKCIRPHQGIKK